MFGKTNETVTTSTNTTATEKRVTFDKVAAAARNHSRDLLIDCVVVYACFGIRVVGDLFRK